MAQDGGSAGADSCSDEERLPQAPADLEETTQLLRERGSDRST